MAARAHRKSIERVVALAAYLYERRGDPPSRAAIVADIPGYPEGAEANRKALHRDLVDLRNHFGIAADYCAVEGCYRLNPPVLTSDERGALVAVAAVARVTGLGDPDPDDIGGAVDADEQRVFVTVPRRIVALCDAIRSRTPAAFDYHGTARTVHAYALGEKNAHWYVTGVEQGPDAPRSYRVDRIESEVALAGTPGSYKIPTGFDATTILRDVDPFTWGPDQRVVARVHLETDHVAGFIREYGGSVVEHIDDGAVVEVEVAHYDAFRWRLLSFGIHARVLEPPVLVEHVRSHLAAIAGA